MISRKKVQKLLLKERIIDGDCWLFKRNINSRGYGNFYIKEICGSFPVHRLSYWAFNGSWGQGKIIRHKCDVPLCFNPKHLCLGGKRENYLDLLQRGEVPAFIKLNPEKVREIRKLRGTMFYKEIAKKYKVSTTAIGDIMRNRTWTWVK